MLSVTLNWVRFGLVWFGGLFLKREWELSMAY